MTDRDDPRGEVPEVPPLDELASAVLDGEATADEQARVDDPDVAARVVRFGEVAAIVGREPEPAPSAEREQAVAAALRAWEGTGETTPFPAVDELADRRRRRARTVRIAGVAAAVVAVVGLGVAVVNLPDSSDDEAASDTATSGDVGESGASGGDDSAAEESADAAAPTTPSEGAASLEFDVAGDLGRFEELDDLVLESAARVAAGAPDAQPSTDSQALAQIAPCAEGALTGANEVRFAGPATVQTATLGTRDVVVISAVTSDGTRVVVLDAGDCEVLADRTP